MSASKIISFEHRFREFRAPNSLSEFASAPTEPSFDGVVIDRRDFRYWAQNSASRRVAKNNEQEILAFFEQIAHCVTRMKSAVEGGRYNEIVGLSARISLLASQLGLPRTARLAADIGEAQMSGESDLAFELIEKLDDIVSALGEDFRP